MSRFLKKLELSGFKSFAEKTSLEFPAGITAIVGPNGSGKSNVIDAVRWLLGERDARQLRGGKVDDLIFAGTPKRPRVGLASASLHFENHDNFFPVDYSEVTVKREIRRDGANKYYLNKSQVRLKDLVDFFAQARLGSRGMTVVTQGNSDVFIRSTPRERREMIEEVLGLKEYQLKRAEAERRLTTSEDNLGKASALTQELLPHLRSLRRQTGKWERRGEIEQNLREMEDVYFGSQWNKLEKKLKETEEDIGGHEKEKEVLIKAKETAEKNLEEIESKEPKEREELKVIKQKTQELLDKKIDLQKDLGKLEARVEIMASTEGESAPDVGALRGLVLEVRDLLKSARDENINELVSEAIRKIDSFLNENKASSGTSDIEDNLKKIENTLNELEGEIKSLKEKESELDGGQEQFYGAFKEAVGELEKVRGSFQDWERAHQEKILAKERVVMRRDELLRQIAQAGRATEEFSGSNSGETVDYEALEKKILRARGDLAAIGEIDEEVQKEASEAEERYTFLKKESEDLTKAISDLRELIKELTDKLQIDFDKALKTINLEFQKFFESMFGPGGRAKLILQKAENLEPINEDTEELDIREDNMEVGEDNLTSVNLTGSEPGVEVKIKLPRKRLDSLEVLSGGERSLVGIAAIFALISVSPPPFLVLDEIDAPLDDRNARRFAEMLREFSKQTQFVIVTHNRATMEAADVLYGVTLNDDHTSKVVSLRLE